MKKNKLTRTGYRTSKNGCVIDSIEKESYKSTTYLGSSTKVNGEYYFFDRKQGELYIYLSS